MHLHCIIPVSYPGLLSLRSSVEGSCFLTSRETFHSRRLFFFSSRNACYKFFAHFLRLPLSAVALWRNVSTRLMLMVSSQPVISSPPKLLLHSNRDKDMKNSGNLQIYYDPLRALYSSHVEIFVFYFEL